jgi:U4/U6.U5 tri-snRNP-associated protein 1
VSWPPSLDVIWVSGRAILTKIVCEYSKIRESLGLKPLGGDDGADTLEDGEAVAEANYNAHRQQELEERAAKEARERIAKAKNQRDLKAKLVGKGLGDAGADDPADTLNWVKRSKKRAKLNAAELARKRAQEQEEFDRASLESATKYGEKDLAGLKVAHDETVFEEGQDHILTLKDSRVLDDAGECSFRCLLSVLGLLG